MPERPPHHVPAERVGCCLPHARFPAQIPPGRSRLRTDAHSIRANRPPVRPLPAVTMCDPHPCRDSDQRHGRGGRVSRSGGQDVLDHNFGWDPIPLGQRGGYALHAPGLDSRDGGRYRHLAPQCDDGWARRPAVKCVSIFFVMR
jgi:hypothetical protein